MKAIETIRKFNQPTLIKKRVKMKIEILTKLNGIVVSHFPNGSEDNIKKASFMKFEYGTSREFIHKIAQWIEESRVELEKKEKGEL